VYPHYDEYSFEYPLVSEAKIGSQSHQKKKLAIAAIGFIMSAAEPKSSPAMTSSGPPGIISVVFFSCRLVLFQLGLDDMIHVVQGIAVAIVT